MNRLSGSATDAELLNELGNRLRGYRLQRNLTADQVAASAGLNRNTVLNAERGKNPRLETVVRLLRTLGRLDALDAFLPPAPVSPLQLAGRRGRPRRRARRRRDA